MVPYAMETFFCFQRHQALRLPTLPQQQHPHTIPQQQLPPDILHQQLGPTVPQQQLPPTVSQQQTPQHMNPISAADYGPQY